MKMQVLRGIVVAALLLAAPSATARATLPVWNEAELEKACATAIGESRKQLEAVKAMPASAGASTVLAAWDRGYIALSEAVGPAYLLAAVHTDEKVRAAADACVLEYTKFNTALFQDEALFKRISALAPKDPIDRKLRADLIEEFEDSGAALPVAKRTRAKELLQRLQELRVEFERNIRDNKTKVAFKPEEMKGLPQAYIDRAKKDENGNYLLGFDYPEYLPFMANADSEEARKRYYVAFSNRGTARNLELMNEIAVLRKELAGLFGVASYAEFITRRQMAASAGNVRRFLEEVKAAVNEGEAREVEEMRAMKSKMTGTPLADTRLNRWDTSYYQEKVRRERYSVDQEALRKYFPMPQAVDFALLVSSELYGIRFKRAEVPVWHHDVVYYDVLDAKGGAFIGGIYLDLYPREGKYKHAAAFPARGGSTLARRTPISILVTNFDRAGMTHREMETLLHEFGHVLHGVLSRTRYNSQAGTNVERDFVEAPSQMFEEWVRRPETLALFKRVCATCPALDEGLIKRLAEARRFGQGVHYSGQHLLATFDQMMTSEAPPDPLEAWKRLQSATPLGYVEGTMGASGFTHNVNHYGARYYGYMWSEVLALDMLSGFRGNLMSRDAGRRFRAAILSPGGEAKAQEMVRRFLGREPNNKAFLAEITGRR